MTILYDKCGKKSEDIIHLGNQVTMRVDEEVLVNFKKHSLFFTILHDRLGRKSEDIIHLGNLVTIRVDEVVLVNFNKHSLFFRLSIMIDVG